MQLSRPNFKNAAWIFSCMRIVVPCVEDDPSPSVVEVDGEVVVGGEVIVGGGIHFSGSV